MSTADLTPHGFRSSFRDWTEEKTTTPRTVVDKVLADVAKALSNPEVRERFVAQGADPGGTTPEQFAAFIRAESDKWTRVVKFSNAKVD